MSKIFVISDTHYGLNSSGYSRLQETDEVMWRVVEKACATRGSILIHCGDLGHSNHPRPEIYAKWVKIWEKLHKHGVVSRFIIGNHDIIHDVEQPYGSLAPLAELGYPAVKIVDGPKYEKYRDGYNLVYLPYLSKSHLGSDPQEFVDDWLRDVLNTFDSRHEKVIIFTHWNVDGANYGGDRIVRQSKLVFPTWVSNHKAVKLIISGHIHLHQVVKSGKSPLVCIGSAIYTDFGDSGEKVYLTIEANDGNAFVKKESTNAVGLVELNYNLVGNDINLKFDKKQVDDCVVKVSVRCTEAQKESIDFDNFRRAIAEHARFVKPIYPIIVREEAHQPVEIKVNWSDEKMVEEWLRSRRPPNASMVGECAKEAMEERQ